MNTNRHYLSYDLGQISNVKCQTTRVDKCFILLSMLG